MRKKINWATLSYEQNVRLKTEKEYKKDVCPQLSIWFQLRSKATLRTDVSFSANHTSNQVIHSLHRNTTHLGIKLNVQKVIRTLLRSVCCNIFVMITYHNLWQLNKCLESHNSVFVIRVLAFFTYLLISCDYQRLVQIIRDWFFTKKCVLIGCILHC